MSYEIRVERLLNTTPRWRSTSGSAPRVASSGLPASRATGWRTPRSTCGSAAASGPPGGIGGTAWREEGTFVEVDQPTRLVYGSLTTPPWRGRAAGDPGHDHLRGPRRQDAAHGRRDRVPDRGDARRHRAVRRRGRGYFARSIPGGVTAGPLLPGRNAVIYGGGGAIGGAVARAFAAEGAGVPGRAHPGPLDLVAGDIRAAGGTADTALVDALDEAAVDAHAEAVVAEAGSLDVTLNVINHGDVQGTPWPRCRWPTSRRRWSTACAPTSSPPGPPPGT